MNTIRVGLLVGAMVVCLASAQHKKYTPERATAPAGVTDEDLWAASVRVLTEAGYPLSDKDREAGVVRTEWSEAGTIPSETYSARYAIRVVVAEGEVSLFIDCTATKREPITGAVTTETCEGEYRPETVADKLPRLRSDIIAEAERRAAKRRAGEKPAEPPHNAPAVPPDAGPLDAH